MSGLDAFLHTLEIKEKARLPLPKDFDPVAVHTANQNNINLLKLMHVSIEKGMPSNPQDIGVGGIGAFVSSLMVVQTLQDNIDSRVILPFYHALNKLKLEYVKSVTHYFKVSCVHSEIWVYINKHGVKEYFVKADMHYQHIFENIKSPVQIYANVPNSSLIERISYFCGAVAAFAMVGDDTQNVTFLPHVLQVHGCGGALIGKIIHKYRELYGDENNRYCSPFTIYNVHSHHTLDNRYDFGLVPAIGISKERTMCLAKDAIIYHDHLVYVSDELLAESAEETSPYFELIRERIAQNNVSAILNNIIADDFDPRVCLDLSVDFYNISDCKNKLKIQLNQNVFAALQKQINTKLPLILFVGRYTISKGIEFLELAIEVALANGASFVSMGYGDSKIINSLKYKYRQSKNIIFIDKDFQHKWGKEIRCAADIFFVPSLLEACGLVPMEANIAGALVVSSSACGLKQVVIDNANGAKFLDRASVSSTLQSVINSWLDLKRTGNLNLALELIQESARKTFDWRSETSDSARQYQTLYFDIPTRNKLKV